MQIKYIQNNHLRTINVGLKKVAEVLQLLNRLNYTILRVTDEQKIRAIVRAYDDGLTLEAISQLFKVNQHDLISIIHAY